MRKVKLLMLTLILSGCVSYGNKVDRNYASSVQKGVTTELEVRNNLGNPMSVSYGADGSKTLIYMHVASQAKAASFIPVVGIFAGGANSQTTMLSVTINPETGIVKDWRYTESDSEMNTGVFNN